MCVCAAFQQDHSKLQKIGTAKKMDILLMEEILHYLGCKKLVNNGINYQPQLVSRIFLHQQYQVSPDTKTGHLTVFLAFKAIS